MKAAKPESKNYSWQLISIESLHSHKQRKINLKFKSTVCIDEIEEKTAGNLSQFRGKWMAAGKLVSEQIQ